MCLGVIYKTSDQPVIYTVPDAVLGSDGEGSLITGASKL